jgi:acyl carrier protein
MNLADVAARVYLRTAELAGLPANGIGPQTTLEGIGLDSSDAVILALDVEELVGAPVDVGVFLRFSTLGEAVEELRRVHSLEIGSGGNP